MDNTCFSKNPTQVDNISVYMYFNDLMNNIYPSFYDSLTSTNIDKEFVKDLHVLSKVARKNNPLVRNCISRLMELYIEKKVDLELNNSFQKILN